MVVRQEVIKYLIPRNQLTATRLVKAFRDFAANFIKARRNHAISLPGGSIRLLDNP